jgi:hypothetical protein
MPIQPINRTFDWGKQGKIEMRSIEDVARSTLAPQPIQQPPGGIDPYKVVDRNLDELKDFYREKEKTLKSYGLAPEAHNQAIAQIQQEYNQAKLKTTMTRLQLDDIKHGIASGQIDPSLGQEAMIRMVVPEETANALFPKQSKQQRGRFTPNEFKSYVSEFSDAIKSAIVRPWLSRNYADPETLKEQYFTQRAKYGYDEDLNPTEKKAFDLAWDQAVGNNNKAKEVWSGLVRNDPDIFTSRTYDQRLLNMAAARAKGTELSPMASSLNKKKPIKSSIKYLARGLSPINAATHSIRSLMGGEKKLTATEAKTILEQAGGDKEKARQMAREMGYKL